MTTLQNETIGQGKWPLGGCVKDDWSMQPKYDRVTHQKKTRCQWTLGTSDGEVPNAIT